MTDKTPTPSDEGSAPDRGGHPNHKEAEMKAPSLGESHAHGHRDPDNDEDRKALREPMNDARRMLKRRRAGVEIVGYVVCPACGGPIHTEHELIQPSGMNAGEWNESYKSSCELCDFEETFDNIWGSGNDVTLHEYLHGHGFDCFEGGGWPLRDDAPSQRLARDSEPRDTYRAYDEIKSWAAQYGLNFASVCEEAQAAGLIAHVDVVTDIELRFIRAAMVRVAKARGLL